MFVMQKKVAKTLAGRTNFWAELADAEADDTARLCWEQKVMEIEGLAWLLMSRKYIDLYYSLCTPTTQERCISSPQKLKDIAEGMAKKQEEYKQCLH